MAISYQILKDKGLVIVTANGKNDINETIQSIDQMFADPEYSQEYDLLWDGSEMTTAFSYDDMQKMARHFKYYKGHKAPKRAFVVSGNVKYGTTRLLNTMASIKSQAQIGLFQDRKEALAWLEH